MVQAKAIWGAHLDNRIAAHITATSLTDIFYLSRRLIDRTRAWIAVGMCLDQLYVLPWVFRFFRQRHGSGTETLKTTYK